VVEETLTGGLRRIIRVPPSPQTLEEISAISGGELFAASDSAELSRVYEDLGSRLGSRDESREITDVFAGVAVAILLVAGVISMLLFRRVP